MRTIRQSYLGSLSPPQPSILAPRPERGWEHTTPREGGVWDCPEREANRNLAWTLDGTCMSSRRYSPNAATTQELLCRRSRGQTIVMGVQASFGLRIWLMGGAVDDI